MKYNHGYYGCYGCFYSTMYKNLKVKYFRSCALYVQHQNKKYVNFSAMVLFHPFYGSFKKKHPYIKLLILKILCVAHGSFIIFFNKLGLYIKKKLFFLRFS